jgi:DNA-binding CsgD family transcriptional regulator
MTDTQHALEEIPTYGTTTENGGGRSPGDRNAAVERLTSRQRLVLRMIASGMTQTRVAEEIGRSEGAVNQMMRSIRHRLRVASTAEAVTAVGMVQVSVTRGRRTRRGGARDDDPRFAIRGMRQVRDRHGITRWERV